MKHTESARGKLTYLRQNLIQLFSIEDLKTICFDLSVDYECIPIGDNKESGARELIAYFERVNRVGELIQKCAKLRPDISWEQPSGIYHETLKPARRLVVFSESDRFNAHIEKIKSHMRKSEYGEAVSYAEECFDGMGHTVRQLDPVLQIGYAEFEVWYAQALIYTGQTQTAITRLNQIIESLNAIAQPLDSAVAQRWNLVVGRGHNNLGYANWMDLGQYESALRTFRVAANHFRTANLKEELATVYDNLGRVYAELGYRTWAELLIEHGQQLRGELPDIPRRALSLNSNAIAYIAFGEPNRAFELSQEAAEVFKQHNNRRGVGLSLLTMGRALRYLSSSTYLKHINPVDRIKKLGRAERVLRNAESNFTKIGERVRLLQVYNELGCVYRERADLFKRLGEKDDALRCADLAAEFLLESVEIAKGRNPNHYDYPPYYADACVDLAQTRFLVGDHKGAVEWIVRAEESVPHSYKFSREITPELAKSAKYQKGTEDFWQQLGKAEALRGRIDLEKLLALSRPRMQVYDQNLRRVIMHYTLAAGYFGRFRTRPLSTENHSLYPNYQPWLENHRIFIEQLYEILQRIEPKDLQSIKLKILPEVLDQYHLDPAWVEGFYSDTLDLLLNMLPASS